jgi:hypothetical protein
MADCLAQVGHGLDSLAGYLSVTGVDRFEAALCIFGGVIVIWVCVAVPSVIRTAQLGGTPRKPRRRSMTTADLAHE